MQRDQPFSGGSQKRGGLVLCSPPVFPGIGARHVDLFALKSPIPLHADLVIGGGGLLNSTFEPFFRNLIPEDGRRLIGWGLGENSIYDFKSNFVENTEFVLPSFLPKFDLLGIRDWGTSLRWVPCASCLHPLFDKQRTRTRDIVVFQHKRAPIDISGFPRMTNEGSELEKTLDFLGSARCVITNSYHGAYWATLMGCRVVAFPFSTKFYRMKHAPALCRPGDWRNAIEQSRAYPEALRECRDANMDFAKEVFHLLKSRR